MVLSPNLGGILTIVAMFRGVYAGCHNLFYLPSMRIGNKKFPVIMRYYCEDIMNIFLVWKEN